jgi:DNA-binding IscR family transcriptional regulator
MDEVVQALEGAIAPMECFVSDHTERVVCSHGPDGGRGCATKLLWTRVQGGIIRSLQEMTLAELVRFAEGAARTPFPARPSQPLAANTDSAS